MSGRPHWFGFERSTFGMLHWPRAPRAGVVICPPLGYEAVGAHRALRLVAEALQDRDIAALRVAFPVTGNSLRTGAADDVAEWRGVIESAVAELRSFGIDRIALVGLRFSATLVASMAGGLGVDALALWEPVVSGRRYSRGLRLLASPVDGGVSVAGILFDDATLTAMSRIALDLGVVGVPTLAVESADATANDPIESGNPLVTIEQHAGTAAMLDVDAELSVVPQPIVDRICDWLDAAFAGAPRQQLAVPALCTSTEEECGDVEVLHRACRVGPYELFAMMSARRGDEPRQAVVFLNNGVAPAVGPGSAWLDWAKEAAKAGYLAVRLDFDGLGDSPVRPGTGPNDSYPTGAAEDVSDLVDALRRRGVERVALVGLCSGALLAFDAALRRAEINHIVAINPRFDKPYHDRRHRDVRAGGQTNRLFAVPLHKTPLFGVFDAIPAPVWRLLALLKLVPRPTLAVERVVSRGVEVTLVFGRDEWGMRAMTRRAPKHFARLESSPLVSLLTVDSLDHSMFAATARRDVEAALRRHFASALAGHGSAPISSSEVVTP